MAWDYGIVIRMVRLMGLEGCLENRNAEDDIPFVLLSDELLHNRRP